jgi:DNA repair exonuclease SbcCD ATPase subunit
MRRSLLLLLLGLFVFAGCQRAYFSALERIGIEKREVLVDRVEEARDSQNEAKEQFRDALDEFSALVGFDGGDLEAIYERLDRAYERSESRADEVRDRIDAVHDVATALFDEWEGELDQYEDRSLRRESERQLRRTRDRYESLLAAMERAERKMAPVLEAFEDQVLFLKHNLNARAIASLEGTVTEIETDVDQLIRDMEASIAEADAFIEEMQTG